ncbi:MAG: hypothetical protein KDC67_06660 [Ignavibacteriae bacterium]|nr:hypothetical protein [Ignavibacteriota bacterium]
MDCSPSIRDYVGDLNRVYRQYILREQDAHTSEEAMLQLITFSSDVKIEHGFKPVNGIDPNDIQFIPRDGMTAGYDALKVALDSMMEYGKQLEQVGTEVVYNIAIVTDGQFNDGIDRDGLSVRPILDSIRSNERLYGKFTITMSGINKDFESYFREAQKNIGLRDDALLMYDEDGAGIHDMMSGISKSQSSSSSGNQTITF